MRGISLMYDLSGGCNREHTCGECKHYEEVKKPVKKKAVPTGLGICYKHPLRVPEWKDSYMACKWWKSKYSRKDLGNKDNQCDGQLDLDMFL